MTRYDLAFMCDENRQKKYYAMLTTLIKEYNLDVCNILGISQKEKYYADKIANGLCKISPTLAKRIDTAYKKVAE